MKHGRPYMWASRTSEESRLHLDPPTVPRVRRPPRQFDAGGPPCIQSVEDYQRAVFFSFWIIFCKRLQIVCGRKCSVTLYTIIVEDTLFSAANNIQPRADLESTLATICSHFGNDIDRRKLSKCRNVARFDEWQYCL